MSAAPREPIPQQHRNMSDRQRKRTPGEESCGWSGVDVDASSSGTSVVTSDFVVVVSVLGGSSETARNKACTRENTIFFLSFYFYLFKFLFDLIFHLFNINVK